MNAATTTLYTASSATAVRPAVGKSGLAPRLFNYVRRWLRLLRHTSFLRVAAYLWLPRQRGEESRVGELPVIPLPAQPHHLEGPVAGSGTIPATVFQTWKSRSVVPGNYAAWRATFAAVNPSYDCLLWDDDDNRALIASRLPWFLETYDRYPREIFRADAVRPCFLYLFGGFYADMDAECLRPLDPLRNRGDVLVGRMGFDPGFEHSVPNAIMASRPLQMFWLLYIQEMIDRAAGMTVQEMDEAGPEALTGPIVLKHVTDYYTANRNAVAGRCRSVLERLPAEWRERTELGRLELLPPGEWFGLDWTNPLHRMLRDRIVGKCEPLPHQTAKRLFSEASMVTYWSHSW